MSGALSGWRARLLDVADPGSWTDTDADLVVIDQFEDGLAAGRAEQMRNALETLVTRCAVIIGLRSDSFAQACELPVVAEALTRPFLLNAMSRDELRAAIVLPARELGTRVDDDLVEVLLDETLPPGDAHLSSSSLPLLSNTLLLVWATSDGRRLTLAGYRRMGGLASAIETLAEETYTALSPERRVTARELLLRLIRPIEGGLLRVSLPLTALDEQTLLVARTLADARLVEFSRDSVRISHDALLTHWTRLRDWVEQRRDDLHARDTLASAAQLWRDNGREPDSLLPVRRLPLFAEWLDDPARQGLLTPDERDFLTASQEHFASQLESERRVSARLRRGRATAVTLAVLSLCLTLVATGAFVRATTVQHQAQSRQIAAEARELRSGDANVRAQMALVADHTSDTREGRSALLDASSLDVPVRWPGEGSGVLASTPDGSVVVRGGGQGGVTLWRSEQLATTPGSSWKADPRGGQIYALALARSANRVLLAVSGTDGFAALWDVTGTPRELASLTGRTGSGNITALSFSADSSALATGDANGAIHLWSLDIAGTPRERASATNGAPISGLGFNPSATTLYASGGNDSVAQWTVAGDHLSPATTLGYSLAGDPGVRSLSLAVSPDGRWLVAGLAAGAAARWELSSPGTPATLNQATGSWVNAVAFSSDSGSYVTGSSGQVVGVFDSSDDTLRRRLTGPSLVTGVALADRRPVAVGTDGTLRVWSADVRQLRSGGRAFYQLASDARGSEWLAAAVPGEDRVELWNLRDGVERATDAVLPDGLKIFSAVYVSPGGDTLMAGTSTGQVVVWPLSATGPGTAAVHQLFPSTSRISSLAVSASGSLVAATEYTGTHTVLYSTGSGQWQLAAQLDTPAPQVVQFNPAGTMLEVGLGLNTVQLWSVETPTSPTLRGSLDVGSTPTTSQWFPNSARIAVGTDSGVVSIWDVSDPGAPRQVQAYTEPQSGIYALSISPDESQLFGGGGDGLIWGWSLNSSGRTATTALNPDIGRINETHLIDGGRQLVAAGDTGEVRIWDTDPAAARSRLCTQRGQVLTESEWHKYLPGVATDDPCS